MTRPPLKAFFCIVASSALLAAYPAASHGEGAEWSSIESRNFHIDYRQGVDIGHVEASLKERVWYFDDREVHPPERPMPGVKMGQRLDELYDRVRELLGMHPAIPKINIKIFRDRKELSGEYFKIFGKDADYRAFYVLKYNTIYTCEDGISDSVMAHEMAHAVIDHYFTIIPPSKISEILASYVDLNLDTLD
jgi:hypothetical protein